MTGLPPRAALALAAFALSAGAGTARAAPAVFREELAGGLELLVVPMPGARTASLRYVVRAGSAHDPPGSEGLAHLLEHLLALGREPGLLADARRAGGAMNAFTFRDATCFLLDAPAEAFPGLAERLLRSITDPRLERADVARERAVVAQEDFYGDRGPGLFSLFEEALFPSAAAEAGPIGTAGARAAMTRADLIQFFTQAYSTRNTTIVLAGAVSRDEARRLVDRAVLLPPALPDEKLAPRPARPALPATSRVRAGFLAATVGYALPAADEAACDGLAELVGLRLVSALRIREARVRDVEVQCLPLRGTPFLLATAYGPSIEAVDLPDQMDRILSETATRPADARERALLAQRLARRAERQASDPSAWADALARSAARPRAHGATDLGAAAPARLSAERLQRAAQHAFRPGRRAILYLSPFGGKVLGGDDEGTDETGAEE